MTGKNFKPGSTATFTLHSDPVVLGTAVVGVDGTVSLTAKVPANVPAGAHTVVITGLGTDGETVEVSLAVKVGGSNATAGGQATSSAAASTTAPATGGLAHTGAAGVLLGGLAMALLLGGLVLFGASRRRASRH